MAGTGMALRRGTNHGPSETGDDVQSSIELLDRVLSEFDDMENANQVQNQIVAPTSVPLSTNNISTNTTPGNVSSTPEDESPSLGGHQSEDDGYMSMNGRKARFALSFRPLTEVTTHQENAVEQGVNTEDFPPPPEEAERLIATLLPRVSTTNITKRNNSRRSRTQHHGGQLVEFLERNTRTADMDIRNGKIIPIHTATQTQTTFPKTRHQRPYGWETQESNFRLHPAPLPPGQRYGSLPISHGIPSILSPQRVPNRTPPRTIPTSGERHREVRRRESEDLSSEDMEAVRPGDADDERFSDDSLEEMLLPPPPPVGKRESIAWEVSLDNDEELLTPGSTKVVGGRRRRRSGENSHSSTSSIPNRIKDLDDWPEPPPCSTEDEVISPFSDSDDPVILPEELRTDLNGSGTYIIRRGRNRKPVPNINDSNSNSSLNSRLSSDLSLLHTRLNTPNSRYSIDLSTPQSRLSQELISPKSRCSLDLNKLSDELISPSNDFRYNAQYKDFNKHSTTFDNIKSFMRESIITRYEPCNEITAEFQSPSPTIVRVVSLPTLSGDEYTPSRRELTVTVEEEEDIESPRQNSAEISPLRKIEKNISQLLEREDIDISSLELNNKNSPIPQTRGSKRIQKSESAKEMLLSHQERIERPLTNSNSADFPVKVDVIQHEFPPLPPSPVAEDDEYSEILHSIHVKNRADTLPAQEVPLPEVPPAVPPHREPSNNSLKTRSMDGGIGRGKRNNVFSSSSRMSSSERRTLPTDLPGTKRRTFNSKRSCQSPREEPHMQTSCSLPETPIFARGCDIPRTPHRRAPEVPPHRTTPRQTATMGNLNSLPTGSSYRWTDNRRGFSNSNLEQALVGAEMLRLAGGPGRGWYPRHRQPRPASIEHLDRLTPSHSGWDAGSRKPLTLPPNLTPKFFHRSPREALRRVTSLLIRKGNNNGKEPKKEKEQAPNNWTNQEEGQKKKGFFKSFWKRSRHYSLEQQ